ncbi:Caspase domain-containing protein [Cystobacter ferrugineus]|nr:Caspase domain-containing protein [Cystobacter ferrugineus]
MTRGSRFEISLAVLLLSASGCKRAPPPEWGGEVAEWMDSSFEDPEPEASEPEADFEPLRAPPRASSFLVLGGGGEPASNEIALEKNVLYFQRTLQSLGLAPESASIYFANGTDGKATVRYRAGGRGARDSFKSLEIPHLKGAATLEHFLEWLEDSARNAPERPVFLYFTGHGGMNGNNLNNNHLALWDSDTLTVRAFGLFLGQLPSTTPVVTMMSQCYSGSFANFIYQDANPQRPVVAQPRCGFFATVEYLPSVGCTPEVDESDYRDYSSSFFAGLAGVSRTGSAVASADHDGDGRVSYAEAHAFAKVDGETTDLPISTSEAWLQRRVRGADMRAFLSKPILEVSRTGRPEQRHVVESLVRRLHFVAERSWLDNVQAVELETAEREADAMRLRMELLNIGMEHKVRASGSAPALAVLERLLQCERGSWESPSAPALTSPLSSSQKHDK